MLQSTAVNRVVSENLPLNVTVSPRSHFQKCCSDFSWLYALLCSSCFSFPSQSFPVQFSRSVMSDSLQPHEPQHARPPCPSPTPGVHWDSCPSSHWCHPAISSCRPFLLLPPIPPSIRVLCNESTLRMRWPKYWRFSFTIIPSKEIPGLISFRMDWLNLLAVQGTLKSLLQHHSSKASILWCSAFFTVQLSYPYMTTGKTIALTRRTFVGKVMFLLLSMLSRLVITFLPRSKCLLISWLQSPSAVILEPPKIKFSSYRTMLGNSPQCTPTELISFFVEFLLTWFGWAGERYHCSCVLYIYLIGSPIIYFFKVCVRKLL